MLAITRPWKTLPEVPQPPPRTGADGQPKCGNFSVRIVREVLRHEAGEITRHVELEAQHEDTMLATAIVPNEDFESMSWVVPMLGMKFVMDVGQSVKDRFQQAIRVHSYNQGVETRHIFTSTGWEIVDGRQVYLHAGGAIGGNGTLNVQMDLPPELAIFALPKPERRG